MRTASMSVLRSGRACRASKARSSSSGMVIIGTPPRAAHAWRSPRLPGELGRVRPREVRAAGRRHPEEVVRGQLAPGLRGAPALPELFVEQIHHVRWQAGGGVAAALLLERHVDVAERPAGRGGAALAD